jgi:lipoprotein-releasing system permease protein
MLGAVLGIIVAVILCWLQVQFHLVPLQGDTFVVSYYPIKMKWQDFVLVVVTVTIVSVIAAWFPARRAALQEVELRS